jgi:hypothetical protein
MSRTLWPKFIPASTSYSLDELEIFSWETLLELGLAYLIGYHDKPPILKFGKKIKVFENLFSLKRGNLMNMFG